MEGRELIEEITLVQIHWLRLKSSTLQPDESVSEQEKEKH